MKDLFSFTFLFFLLISKVWAEPFGFLLLEGIQGSAEEKNHEDWSEFTSATWSVQHNKESAEKPRFRLLITKPVDRASPHLWRNVASGQILQSATLELLKPLDQKVRYFQVELKVVTLVSISNQAEASGKASAPPTETISMTFQEIEWAYTEFDLTGEPLMAQRAYWDLVKETGDFSIVPALRMEARRVSADGLQLQWLAEAGTTYRILADTNVSGPYAVIQEITPETSGVFRHNIQTGQSKQFFLIEKVGQ